MTTYLDSILARKRLDLAVQKEKVPLAELRARVLGQAPPKDLGQALVVGGVQVIAEIKKASPSKGVMAGDLDPVATAKTYADNGAAAISVLTEEPHFQGRLEFLTAIRAALGTHCPVLLRKDFILEPYQVYEARGYGADSLLLIVAALSGAELMGLLALARQMGMEPLVEVHDAEEARRATDVGAQIIGINNRDLHTFKTSLATTAEVRPFVPADRVVVSESGISTRQDVALLVSWGVNAMLVGEALVTAPDIGAKLRDLRSAGAVPAVPPRRLRR